MDLHQLPAESVPAALNSTQSSPDTIADLPNSTFVDTLVTRIVIVASHVATWVPWPIWHVFASCVGMVAMFAGWRRVVLANVRHVRHDKRPNFLAAWFIGMQQIASHVKTVVGILQTSISKDDLADTLKVEGLENLEPHLGQRGIIIVAPHAGPYPTLGMMASRWLRARAFTGEFAVVVRLFEPMRSRALLEWFSSCFHGAGVTVIDADSPPRVLGRRLRSVLDNRGIVVLFVDEPTPTLSMAVPFFDSSILLPAGPVRLAKATGSVIIPGMATYGRGREVTLQIAKPIEPSSKIDATLGEVSSSLEGLISQHLDQWSMLTPIWAETEPEPAPKGFSFADLHTHTIGSDGLCTVEDWSTRAAETSLAVLAVTDHDHISTVRRWNEAHRGTDTNVLPGVEITARGRIVHIGILFPHQIPTSLPKPGTPLFDVMRWARSIDGSLIVLVHPLPVLWRVQLRRLARAGLLPDAIETSFPLAFWRTGSFERAADRYELAKVGGTDAHLLPDQLGKHVTLYPGETIDDLVQAIRSRSTEGVVRPVQCRPPLSVYALQSIYSWLLPFRAIPSVERTRQRLLMTARRKALASSTARRRTPRDVGAAAKTKRREVVEQNQRTG